MKWLFLNIILLFWTIIYSQNDSLPYTLMENKWTVSSTLGFNSAPFVITDNFNLGDNRIQYKTNMNPVLGVGVSHKSISIGFSLKLPGYLRDTKTFGETEYFDFDFRFNQWGWHFSGDINSYEGFRLKNNTIEQLEIDFNKLLYKNLNTFSSSLNGYYFFDSTYNTKAAFGMLGKYNQQTYSFYIKNTLNVHRIKNEQSRLLPNSLNNPNSSIWDANNLGALDGGIVPGFAYVNTINNWQFGGMMGIGAVIQAKYFTFSNQTRVFFGLAPRVDLNFYAGYNNDDWFLMLHTNLNNKSIRFNDFKYRQVYYYIRLTAGRRLESLKLFKD